MNYSAYGVCGGGDPYLPDGCTQAEIDGEEVGEQEIETYGFDWALDEMRSGKKVSRLGWNGNSFIKIKENYIYYFTKKYNQIWENNNADLLAEDWVLVEG